MTSLPFPCTYIYIEASEYIFNIDAWSLSPRFFIDVALHEF